MPDTAIDTNVLVDVLLDDPDHGPRSAQALDDAARLGALVIGPATLAELATVFARHKRRSGLQDFLAESAIRVTPLADGDAVAAGEAFARHLGKRRGGIPCASCGKRSTACGACGRPLRGRDRIATDFLILAHARTAGRLLTRDSGLRMANVTIVRP